MTSRRALLVVAAAAALYAMAAWSVRPGFYDGVCPQVDYLWLVPPAGIKATKPPGSVTESVNNQRGPYFAATSDPNPQATFSWVPGAYDTSPTGSVTVSLKAVDQCPAPSGVRFTTNVYQLTTSAPLAKQGNLRLTLPPNLPAATTVYHAGADCHWTTVPNPAPGGCGDISVQTTDTGFFAAGVTGNAATASGTRVGGGSQLLPLLVAGGIVLVLLAGIPVAMARRRPAKRVGPKRRDPPRT